MLEYDNIHMSEGSDVNKTSESRRCIICNYYYFLKVHFRFQLKVYNSCHDLKQKAKSLNYVEIVSVKRNDCKIHFYVHA